VTARSSSIRETAQESIFNLRRQAMKKTSLVLVTVDCLRADHVGFLGYSRPVTPGLDSLAEDSIVFSNAVVAGAPTYFSFPAIMASRYPLALGRDILGIAPGEFTLATSLRGGGYTTAAFLAGNPYLSPRFGYDQGFDTFRDFLDAGSSSASALSRPSATNWLSNLNRRIQADSRRTHLTAATYDELYFWYSQSRLPRENLSMDSLRVYPAAHVVVDQAQSWLSSLDEEPFFLWLHLMDPHHPYYPPLEALSSLGESRMTPWRARFLNSFWNRGGIGIRRLQRHREEILSLYDAGIRWVDKQISRLVHALQQFQRWDETVFVVTADHGEEFLEHGNRYHSPTNLSEQLIHVPLLIRSPELSGSRLSQGHFSLIHLAPTLLDAVGMAVPDSFQGRSYWEEIAAGNFPSETAVIECIRECSNPSRPGEQTYSRLMAVRDAAYKLVIDFSGGTDFLYDLESDPGEYSPVPDATLASVRARLLQVARVHLQETKRNRNVELRLLARLREIQQSMGAKRKEAPAPSLAD
jgi:arylsulfatase A-like enzyme